MQPIPQRPGGIRCYGQDDLDRLHFIRHAQGLGFSLEEVAELLALDYMQDRQAACALAQSKLTQIDDRIRLMGAMRGALASLVSCCENAPGSASCPILRALAGKTHPT
ncbi:MAG: MerR family DNA-binding protein [Rhodocyclaceae bacterium]|nr:MerR family DNA-binding protein [Rhodocyclaceae bacterium]